MSASSKTQYSLHVLDSCSVQYLVHCAFHIKKTAVVLVERVVFHCALIQETRGSQFLTLNDERSLRQAEKGATVPVQYQLICPLWHGPSLVIRLYVGCGYGKFVRRNSLYPSDIANHIFVSRIKFVGDISYTLVDTWQGVYRKFRRWNLDEIMELIQQLQFRGTTYGCKMA